MGLRMKNFNIVEVRLKIWFLGGGSRKTKMKILNHVYQRFFNAENIVKEKRCFKSLTNPNYIDFSS